MNYSTARSQIRTGDCLLFTGGDWRSWHGIQVMLLRMFHPSRWSHIGTAWVALDRVMVMESVGTGVRNFPLSMSTPFGWIKRPTQMSTEALNFAFSQMGKRYPSKIKMVLNKVFGMHLDVGDTLDCSDYFTRILAQDGIDFSCAVDPATLAEEVCEHWGELITVTKDPL